MGRGIKEFARTIPKAKEWETRGKRRWKITGDLFEPFFHFARFRVLVSIEGVSRVCESTCCIAPIQHRCTEAEANRRAWDSYSGVAPSGLVRYTRWFGFAHGFKLYDIIDPVADALSPPSSYLPNVSAPLTIFFFSKSCGLPIRTHLVSSEMNRVSQKLF